MKSILILFAAILVAGMCLGQSLVSSKASATTPPAMAAFSWRVTSYDFGKTKIGIPITYEFGFANTGMVPLIISSVKATCGCTVTAYTKDPVERGSSGFVRVSYDAAHAGAYSKTVTVYANTVEGMVKLTIKGAIVQ